MTAAAVVLVAAVAAYWLRCLARCEPESHNRDEFP